MAEILTIVGAAAAASQLFVYARKARHRLKVFTEGFEGVEKLAGQVEDICRIVSWMETTDLDEDSHATILRCRMKLSRLAQIIQSLEYAKQDRTTCKMRVLLKWAKYEGEARRLMDDLCDVEFSLLGMFLMKRSHRQKSERLSASAPSSQSMAIPPRNPLFTGHENTARWISHTIEISNGHTRLALVGLGGVGKSALAIEAAHRLQQSDPDLAIFFIKTSTKSALQASCLESIKLVGNLGNNLSATGVSGHKMMDEFPKSSSPNRWLMIIDGADVAEWFFGSAHLFELLPQSANGSIIFTSRNRDLAAALINHDLKNLVHVNALPEEAAVQLFTKISHDDEINLISKTKLVNELACLPLAITQAATFIRQKPLDTKEYLDIYTQSATEQADLLAFEPFSLQTPTKAVLQTWLTSFEEIQRQSNLASDMLYIGACLDPHSIPISIISEKTYSVVDTLSALGLLEAYFMIRSDRSNNTIDIHPLVHFALKHHLKSTESLRPCQRAGLRSITQEMPLQLKRKADFTQGKKLHLHAQALLDGLSTLDDNILQLYSYTANYLYAAGYFTKSLKFAEAFVQGSQRLHGMESTTTLKASSRLALVHQALGDYEECQALTGQVLNFRIQLLGHEHPDVLSSLNNKGLILHRRGRYDEAEAILTHVLHAKERVLGVEHDSTVKTLNNLALTIQDQGRHEIAEAHLRRAAKLRRFSYGSCHTATLLSLNNLAAVLQLQGRFIEAGSVYEEVCHSREELLGSRHCDTLRSWANLALNLLQQSQCDQAETILEQVLKDLNDTLGPDHVQTLETRVNMANVMYFKGDLQQTARVYMEVHEAWKVILGEKHPITESIGSFADEVKAEIDLSLRGGIT